MQAKYNIMLHTFHRPQQQNEKFQYFIRLYKGRDCKGRFISIKNEWPEMIGTKQAVSSYFLTGCVLTANSTYANRRKILR